jgi:hypothetical protein
MTDTALEEKKRPYQGPLSTEEIIPQPNHEENRRFFDRLTTIGGAFILGRFTNKRKIFELWTGNNQISSNENWYYTFNPRYRYNEYGQGKKEDIRFVSGFFADIDYGEEGHQKPSFFSSEEDALGAIGSFPLTPTYVMHTGHGFQCLWLFADTIEIGKDIGLEEYEAINRNIQVAIGADTTPDITRLLRLPGSFNVKDPDNPVPVMIVQENNETYSLAHFDNFRNATEPLLNWKEEEPEWTEDRLSILLKTGIDPANPEKRDRSALIQSAVYGLVNQGYSNKEIYTEMLNPENKLSEKILEKNTDHERKAYIDRSIRKAKSMPSPKTKTPTDLKRFFIDQGLCFRKNELLGEIEVVESGKSKLMTDGLLAGINNRCRDAGITNTTMIRDVIIEVADKNTFHPLKEYFENLTPPDNRLTISTLVKNYFQLVPVEELDVEEVCIQFLRKWFIGAVHRVFTGTHNTTLVIEGGQGIGKSRFSRWLVPDIGGTTRESNCLYVAASISADSKDEILKLARVFIWEINEFGATTRRADRERLKGLLSLEQVDVRPPYGRFEIHKRAITNFIATVNNENGFLNDPTGSRRFASFSFKAIDMNSLDKLSSGAIWYEAYQSWKAGERPFFTDEEKRLQAILNTQFESETLILDMMEDIFEFTQDKNDFLSFKDIVLALSSYEGSYPTVRLEKCDKEIREILLKKGAIRHRLSHGGARGFAGIKIKE